MNAREIEDYVEINKSSVAGQAVYAVMAHRQQSLIPLQRGPRFPVFLGFKDEWDL